MKFDKSLIVAVPVFFVGYLFATVTNTKDFFDQISSNYKAVAKTLKLPQYKKDQIEKKDYEERIEEVFRCWDENATHLAGGRYPHTWKGLWDILEDSDLIGKAEKFFDFLNRHES